MSENLSVKYCVFAIIDLLGFSNHLEIGAHDLRTNIGQQAVDRLECLDKAIELLTSEKERLPNFYPNNLNFYRLNDAILISMDLDDILIPSVGRTRFQGLSANDIGKYFSEDDQKDEATFVSSYHNRISSAIEPIAKLIGIIARIHLFVNKLEGTGYFPGARTVVSTGFRKPFHSRYTKQEDFFSANFSLANAYAAERSLSGPSLYVDNYIIQMLSHDLFIRNVLQFAHFHFKEAVFSSFEANEDVFQCSADVFIPELVKIELFRKEYAFRNLNPARLSHLQIVPMIVPHLKSSNEVAFSNIFYRHVYHAIRYGVHKKDGKVMKPSFSFIYNSGKDISKDIGISYEFLSTGKSETRNKEAEKKLLADFNLDQTSEGNDRKKRLKEWLEQEVEIGLQPLSIEEHKETLFQFDEETISGLMPFLEGDITLLDYKSIE